MARSGADDMARSESDHRSVIENGFYYDFDSPRATEEDLAKIEKRCKKLSTLMFH